MTMASTTLERRKRNWENFIAHHIQTFHGLRTKWDPNTCKAVESFQTTRQFSMADGNGVIQKNTHYYEDKDPLVLGPWSFTFEENALADGFLHPHSTTSRGYFLNNGDAVWALKMFQEGQPFAQEIFFCQGHIRASIGCVFLADAKLSRVSLNREDSHGWPSPKWTPDLTLASFSEVPDDWPSAGLQLKGREKVLTADLEEIDGEIVAWKAPKVEAGCHAYRFPDGYMVICPDILTSGVEIEITALCHTTLEGTAIRQITTFYNAQGEYTKVREVIFK